MRDIGDRHDQAEAVAVGFAPHRVIEILGVLAIDGDQRECAQVEPLEDVGLLHVERHRGRLGQDLRRKLVRDLMCMDRRFHRQRRCQLVTKHRQHLADRRAMLVLRLGDLDHDQLAMLCVLACVLRDHHVALDALVVGHDIGDAGLFGVATKQAIEPALQHLDDRAFLATAAIDTGDTGQHAIAMGDLAHLVRRQEQVIAATIRTQEAESVRIGNDGARHQVGALCRYEPTAPILQQLAVAQHRLQPLLQCLEAVRRRKLQFLRQPVGIHWPVMRGQDLQDHLAAGDGLRVAPGLARRMRVLSVRMRPRRRRRAHGTGKAGIR